MWVVDNVRIFSLTAVLQYLFCDVLLPAGMLGVSQCSADNPAADTFASDRAHELDGEAKH